ncbi:MAG: molybdenum cofactor guanylyltransferase [Planctomycetales bacterium]|nr:molybdenum cofactor guanylyltransferase [Planctomycetales bacterium]
MSVSALHNEASKKGAIILCGGKSSRMGRDKATLPFGPELMLQRIVRLLSEEVDSSAIAVVSAKGQILPPLPPEIRVVCDENPGRGPLEGLAAGLKGMPDHVDAVYATSCDVPLMATRFVRAIFDHLGNHEIAVPVEGQFHHPLAAVYRPRVLAVVQQLLAANKLRPRFLFDEVDTMEVDVESLRVFDPTLSTLMNLNHPEDYEKALEQLENRS